MKIRFAIVNETKFGLNLVPESPNGIAEGRFPTPDDAVNNLIFIYIFFY